MLKICFLKYYFDEFEAPENYILDSCFILRAVENVQRKLAKTKESLRQRIKCVYPVLSRIQPWMRNKLRNVEVNTLYCIRVKIC
jgi:hypothetical protein